MVLAHKHELGADDPVRESAHSVQERTEIELFIGRHRVQGSSASRGARARGLADAFLHSSAEGSCTCGVGLDAIRLSGGVDRRDAVGAEH
jgi:hypothetical protein